MSLNKIYKQVLANLREIRFLKGTFQKLAQNHYQLSQRVARLEQLERERR